ncbi:MAG: hypothetical protein LUG16_03065 [Candidatus Gastranaerophilales bacterium]|nr:hypothetical protein [Candidatus Gastranaerophilales bacterium]
MKKQLKNRTKLLILILTTLIFSINADYIAVSEAATATPVKTYTPAYLTVSPIDVVNNSAKYLNKNITFTADFVAFTSLGLDYKPAYRNAEKYIGILIKRDDVKNNVIPLSEMKIFLTREIAEKNVDLETGDKIQISGKVFSTALGDPWVDVTTFKVLSKKEKKAEK